MLTTLLDRLESGRIKGDKSWGPYGMFVVPGPCGKKLCIVASGANADDEVSAGWEHVSVSTRRRCPNWTEMCFVKDLFWAPEECVVQFHPPKSEYVNNHPFVLHLWKHRDNPFPTPPSVLVGLKNVGMLTRKQADVINKALGK
jgi:hypothetical protein